jgi:methyl coenzyme M reductase beta subunit
MRKELKNKIEDSLTDLEAMGGLKNKFMKKVINKTKKAISINKKTKK